MPNWRSIEDGAGNAAEAHRMLAVSQAHQQLVAQIVPSPFGLAQNDVVREMIADGFLGEFRELVVIGISDNFHNRDAPLHWRQVKEIFQAAVELPEAEREAYLAGACGGDPSLRTEIESLIAAHEEPGSFLGDPAFDIAAEKFNSVRDAGGLVLGASNESELKSTLDYVLTGKILAEQPPK